MKYNILVLLTKYNKFEMLVLEFWTKTFLFTRSKHWVHTLNFSLFTKQTYRNIFCTMSVHKKPLFFWNSIKIRYVFFTKRTILKKRIYKPFS